MEAVKENKTETQKGKLESEQKKKDEPRVKTVTPDNDNGDPGIPSEGSSNKSQESKDTK